jgi:DNA polymerase III subunit delta
MAKPVYALVGEDSFLQLQELGRILRDMPGDVQRMDYDGEQAELADVLDELRSFAMFGGGKLVLVRNGDEFVSRYREQLEDFLEKPLESSTLVLRMSSLPKNQRIYKLINKVGQVSECSPPRDLARWAIEHAKTTHKATLTPDAARALVELIGDSLGRMDTEIAKLAVQADGKPITAEMVDEAVTDQREREMKELTIALASGRTIEALQRWRDLLRSDPSAEFRAVTWLTMWLEDVRAYLRSPEAAMKNLAWKYKGDSLGAFRKTATAMGKSGVARMIDALAEVDYKSKTGVGMSA